MIKLLYELLIITPEKTINQFALRQHYCNTIYIWSPFASFITIVSHQLCISRFTVVGPEINKFIRIK